MPNSWLAWAKFSDLTSTEKLGDELLKPFGMQLIGFKQLLHQFAGDSLAMDRPVVFGAAYSEVTHLATGFAIIPIDDFEDFAARQGLSVDEELWLSRFFGVDLVMVPVENYLWITQLDAGIPTVSKETLEALSIAKEEEVTVQFSDQGLEELSEWLDGNKSELLKSTRGRLPRVAQPKDLAQVLRQSIRYSPLVTKVSSDYLELKLSVSSQQDQLMIKASLFEEGATDLDHAKHFQISDNQAAKARLAKLFESAEITYQGTGNLNRAVYDLVLNAYLCHPESVESIAYHQKSYNEYLKACLALTDAIESIEFLDMNPVEEKPIGRNEVVLLQMNQNNSADEVESLFANVATNWNLVIDYSRARVKLKVDKTTEQIKLSETEDGLESTLFSIDMIEAFGGTRYQEIEDLFESLYGEDCKLKIRLIPLKEHCWVLTLLPKAEAVDLIKDLLTSDIEKATIDKNSSKVFSATYYPDKHLAWLRKIDDLMYKDSVGRKVKKPMPPVDPVAIVFTESSNGLHAKAEMPIATYQEVIAYLLAPKVKPEAIGN